MFRLIRQHRILKIKSTVNNDINTNNDTIKKIEPNLKNINYNESSENLNNTDYDELLENIKNYIPFSNLK